METKNNIGIWMDNSTAHLIELVNDSSTTKIIASKFTHDEKERSLNKSEHIMHNKEQHQQADYYKKLGAVILNYKSVLLFGPTNAKAELHNVLKEDHRFEKIKIEVKEADKMTENQQYAFVKEHFKIN